jgi:predicted nucleic acid-binding Zn ribbon protein
MKQQPSPIKDVLGSVISKISGEKKEKIDQIRRAWDKILDKKSHKHVRLTSFKEKKLIVNVDSSAWMYELNLRKQQLLEGLNKQLRQGQVKEIVLRIGEVA